MSYNTRCVVVGMEGLRHAALPTYWSRPLAPCRLPYQALHNTTRRYVFAALYHGRLTTEHARACSLIGE